MAPMMSLHSWVWRPIEWLYRLPPAPAQKRTAPMRVLCVGPPRSATESLQQALLALGYDYTYHGWDVIFDTPTSAPGWVRLARKKFYDGVAPTREDFDELLGHSVAVTDAAASCFAAEMIAAYPEAKVVLNVRRDLEAWHRSAVGTLAMVNRNWPFYLTSWLNREAFWAWHVYERFLWPLLFRAPDGDLATAIERNGKWIYREHCAMIKGLVPADRLLEWSVDEGWEPLCRFLGEPVPDEPFPRANTLAGGWKAREEQCNKRWVEGAIKTVFWLIVAALSIIWWWLR